MMLQRATGIEFKAVPYRGGAPLLTDMLAGAIPVSFNVLGEVLPHIRGRQTALVSGCAVRSGPSSCPRLPTMEEQGFADIALTEWLGCFLQPRPHRPTWCVTLNGVRTRGAAGPRDGCEPSKVGA